MLNPMNPLSTIFVTDGVKTFKIIYIYIDNENPDWTDFSTLLFTGELRSPLDSIMSNHDTTLILTVNEDTAYKIFEHVHFALERCVRCLNATKYWFKAGDEVWFNPPQEGSDTIKRRIRTPEELVGVPDEPPDKAAWLGLLYG